MTPDKCPSCGRRSKKKQKKERRILCSKLAKLMKWDEADGNGLYYRVLTQFQLRELIKCVEKSI